jgi:hypothetical protein
VQLPESRHAAPLPWADEPGAPAAAVTAKADAYLGITPATPGELPAKLNVWLAGRGGKPVLVKADARAEYARLAALPDALRRAGVETLFLRSSQRDSPEPVYPVPPKGLEVSTGPSPAPVQALRSGARPALEGRPKAVALQPGAKMPAGEVVRAIDERRGAGARVCLR